MKSSMSCRSPSARRIVNAARTLLLCLLACAGNAWALSCPTLQYQGISPSTGALVDPAKPTFTLSFNRNLNATSVKGGTFVWFQATLNRGDKLISNGPQRVHMYDDYGLEVPINVSVSGSNIYVTPVVNLAPTRGYRLLLQASSAYPIVAASRPGGIYDPFCAVPAFTASTSGSYFTRQYVTSGCLSSPIPMGTQFGLARGCAYSLTYRGDLQGDEEMDHFWMTWAFGAASVTRYVKSIYPISEELSVNFDIKDIRWDGAQWVATSVVATAVGTPQSGTPAEGSVLYQGSNVMVAGSNDLLQLVLYRTTDTGATVPATPGNTAGSTTIGPK